MNYTVREDLSLWVCYSRYEIKEDSNGRQYITPAPDATPIFYNLQRKQDTLVLDAVNVGMLCLGKKSDAVIQEAVMEFVSRYGLLGLMTALSITPDFWNMKWRSFRRTASSGKSPWRRQPIRSCSTHSMICSR